MSISVWAQWIAMLLRHSSSPNPSSIETLIHSHQTYFCFRDWERLNPCPKSIFPETKHAMMQRLMLVHSQPFPRHNNPILIYASFQQQAFPSLLSIKILTLSALIARRFRSSILSQLRRPRIGLCQGRLCPLEDPATLVLEKTLLYP